MKHKYNTIEEALKELRAGKIVLVTDDPDRENEGDMICAAEFATQENINFMACHAKQGWGCRLWWRKIRILIRPHLLFPLITWIHPQESRLPSVLIP